MKLIYLILTTIYSNQNPSCVAYTRNIPQIANNGQTIVVLDTGKLWIRYNNQWVSETK